MDVEFSEEQEVIRQTAREFFQEHCPLAVVRELEASPAGWSPELWRRMCELDWAGLSYPEEYGGAGGTLLDLFAIYLELGRSLAPTPHLTAAVLCGETILRAGSELQRKELLPRIASGDALLTLAHVPPSGAFGAEAVELRATRAGSDWRLSGAAILVPYAQAAEHVLAVARCQPGEDGLVLLLADPRGPGVRVEQLDNIAGYPLFALVFDDATVPGDAVVGEPGLGWAALSPALDRASVLQCAELVGAGERIRDMTVQYAKDRVQFGRPIGQFQAVQYLCSDVAIDVHMTSLLARQAAWALDEGQPHRGPVARASAYASRAAQHIVHCAHEVFAGAAFVLEHDLQLFTRRAKHWEFHLGDAQYHLDRAADALV